MASEGIWRIVRGRLSAANGDEFERTALHYLRATWPSMIQAPRMQRLDRFGVDLCVPARDMHFDVVVQTKGFKVDERLLDSQVEDQILPSIEKYRRSPLTCDDYVLLHNRDGSERRLASVIEAALDNLVTEGKAKSVRLWDRDAFIKDTRNQIDQRIRHKLTERSRNLLRQHESFFHFGHLFVSHVPLRQSTWKPGSMVQSDFPETGFVDTNASKLIASPRKVRYALLIGSFGIGKTTTTLRAVNAKELLVVYVPAHTIQRDHGSQGTNFLLRNINDELDLLDDLPEETAEVLRDVMGAALGRVLRQPNDAFVLVIDGLDEHSFYGSPHGLQWITNELSELRCPIVLTTRREHFLSLIGNYELAVQTLSKKGGAQRIVDVYELGPWSLLQAKELLESAIRLVPEEDKAARIRWLLDQLQSSALALTSALLRHPLFLQMTLDLIMDGEEGFLDDEEKLIDIWIRKKIQRDLLRPRISANVHFDVEAYVEGMLDAMTQIAMDMHDKTSNMSTLSDSIDTGRMLTIARKALAMPDLDETTIFTTSLLVPSGRRRGRVLDTKFFHRAFQEHFFRRGKQL